MSVDFDIRLERRLERKAASARDQFDPPHVRDVATTSVRLAFKPTLKPNVKIIAHGSALRHNPDPTETWEGNTAYESSTVPSGIRGCPPPATWWVKEASQRVCHFSRTCLKRGEQFSER